MLDDLRKAAIEQDSPSDGDSMFVPAQDEGKLFGMTALERMFLSMGIFGITLIISMIMLIATDSIRLF